jgi:hypothetical protein
MLLLKSAAGELMATQFLHSLKPPEARPPQAKTFTRQFLNPPLPLHQGQEFFSFS